MLNPSCGRLDEIIDGALKYNATLTIVCPSWPNRQDFGIGATMAADGDKQRPKSNWAQMISAGLGAVAIIGVGMQVRTIKQNFSEASARQVYMSYSESLLKYPEFTEPDLTEIKKDRVKYVQYKNFVAHMLFAYDEILSVYDKPEWRRNFDDDLRYHMKYLCNDTGPDLDAMYFQKVRQALGEARAKCPALTKSQ